MIRPIVAYGQPILQQAAAPVSTDQEGLPELIQDMFDTMAAAGGIGLAAPQVNVGLRLFITGKPNHTDPFFDKETRYPGKVFINPEIRATGGLFSTQLEGCLSLPHMQASVLRPTHIRVRYQDHLMETHEESFSGYMARVIQHEFDHLEGVLITDRIHKHRQKSLRPHLRAIANGKVEADYALMPN